nr:ubiquitin thioesterase OTU1 [Cryptococcus depauperatus CBS 7855]
MSNLLVGYSGGTTTLDFDPSTTTLDDLKALIFSSTGIVPNEQEIKHGYPPKPLSTVSGVLGSLIGKGEQLIVSSIPASVVSLAPAPASLTRQQNQPVSVSVPDSIPLPGQDASYLQLRIVPDDNSCLFNAIGVVFEGSIEAAPKLRGIVAEAIKRDPDTYSDVMLGAPRNEYIEKIQKPDTWGGAIELSIFAKQHVIPDTYKTEIASFDVATCRCDRFGQDEYDSMCLLVYSGIHYDAITLSPEKSAPPSFHTTIFSASSLEILETADKLVAQLQARHYYTDTSNFDLKCGVCGKGLKGEKGAKEHAMQTGHVEFGEY